MKSDEQKSNSVLSGRDARSDERHTPAPWTHYDDSAPSRYHPQHKIQSRGKSIATVYCTRGDEATDAANARLIAAAPDLLLALKAMTEEWVDYMTINHLGDPWAKHNMKLARAAIAKAEER